METDARVLDPKGSYYTHLSLHRGSGSQVKAQITKYTNTSWIQFDYKFIIILTNIYVNL